MTRKVPPKVVVSTLHTSGSWGRTECDTWPAPAWEGRRGAAAAAPVNRGTTAPLLHTNNIFPTVCVQATWTLLKIQTSLHARTSWHAHRAFLPTPPAWIAAELWCKFVHDEGHKTGNTSQARSPAQTFNLK